MTDTQSPSTEKTEPAEDTEFVRLADFVENPHNLSTATDADIERLAGKLKRVPLGLTAMRIAYVTDIVQGKKTVISGNKRLRVLKRAYGEEGEVPAQWFQDVSVMNEAERREFIVDANVSDGAWDVDALMADYGKDELAALLKPEELDELLASVDEAGEIDAIAGTGYGVDEYEKNERFFQLTLLFDIGFKARLDGWLRTHEKSELSAMIVKGLGDGD